MLNKMILSLIILVGSVGIGLSNFDWIMDMYNCINDINLYSKTEVELDILTILNQNKINYTTYNSWVISKIEVFANLDLSEKTYLFEKKHIDYDMFKTDLSKNESFKILSDVAKEVIITDNNIVEDSSKDIMIKQDFFSMNTNVDINLDVNIKEEIIELIDIDNDIC